MGWFYQNTLVGPAVESQILWSVHLCNSVLFDVVCFPVSVEETGTIPDCEWWLVIGDGETILPGG